MKKSQHVNESLYCCSLESSTCEVYKLRKSDDEKRKRIDSFKMKLEDSNGMHQALSKKEERIRNLEER